MSRAKFWSRDCSFSVERTPTLGKSHRIKEVNCNADLPGVTPKISVTLYKSEHKLALAKSNLKMQQKLFRSRSINLSEGKFMSKKAIEHHHKAAEHHEHAARHHKEAAKHHEAGKHETAAHHAHLARGHHEHASHHAGEAAKAHIEDHGKAMPARA
jgi:hypothetical protein